MKIVAAAAGPARREPSDNVNVCRENVVGGTGGQGRGLRCGGTVRAEGREVRGEMKTQVV